MSRAVLLKAAAGLGARMTEAGEDLALWVHGYTLDSSSWADLWALLPEYRHVGVDLPGHGISLPLGPTDDLPALAGRIGRFAVERRVCHLVALSFGTVVALQMAIDFPGVFRTVTLASPAIGGGPTDDGVAARYAELTSIYRRHGCVPRLRDLWMASPPDLFKGAEANPVLWRRLQTIVGRHGWWELADGSFAALSNHVQTGQALARIDTRLLLLVGENELPTFKRCAELIRRQVRRCERLYLRGVGHLSLLEDPVRAAATIRRHWESDRAAPDRIAADPLHQHAGKH